ncbi:MAG: hypothetical protein M3Q70_01980 [bacterium]|nr:hypothetical protein [bacterium]
MSKFNNIVARASRVFVALAIVSAQLVPAMLLPGKANAGPNEITASTHQGQELPGLTYTPGNVTTYKEGDFIKFRFTLTSGDASEGRMSINFSEFDGDCVFFTNFFELTSVVNTSGTSPVVTVVGAPTDTGSEWTQLLDIDFNAGGEAVVNYKLQLSQNAGECNGSSQHSRLDDVSGEFNNIGQQNVPVPANQIIELPEIVARKLVDTNGDGQTDRTAFAGEWSFSLDGGTPVPTNASGQVTFTNVTPNGAHTITETAGPVSQTFLSGTGTNCTFSGAVATATVSSGTTSSDGLCIFSNTLLKGSITIIKDAVPNHAQDFAFTTTGSGLSSFLLDDDANATLSNTKTFSNLLPGTYSVTETATTGWDMTGLVCGAGGSVNGSTATITLAAGANVTCTYTNKLRGQIIVSKVTDPANDTTGFPISISPTTGVAPATARTIATNSPQTFSVAWGTAYSVSEDLSNLPAWTLTENGCLNKTINSSTPLDANGVPTITCTITNTKDATLTLRKLVTNDNGGTAHASAWTLKAQNGANAALINEAGAPATGAEAVTSTVEAAAGTGYTLSEAGGPAGYEASAWSCTSGSLVNSVITLTAGQNAVCTITNNDIAPLLTVIKNIQNDNGGDDLVDAFNILLSYDNNGDDVNVPLSFETGTETNDSTPYTASPVVIAGREYTLSELGLAGYNEGTWSCGTTSEGGITTLFTLSLAQNLTCTITNNDIAPTLTVVKNVVNDNGGNATVGDFNVSASSIGELSFNAGSGTTTKTYTAMPTILANTNYTLSEANLTGYTEGSWSCTDSVTGPYTGATVNLSEGENVTCTITNNDTAPMLEVGKRVFNNNGGTKLAEDFEIYVNDVLQTDARRGGGDVEDSGVWYLHAGTMANALYTVSEGNEDGYAQESLVCMDLDTELTVSHPVTLALGQRVSCTVTNNDIAPSLTLNKILVKDNGGTAVESNWTLTATGTSASPTNLTGAGASGSTDVVSGASFKADTYTLAETTGPTGYTPGLWTCTNGITVNANNQITLANGQTTVCSITNDDQAGTITVNKVVTNDNGGTKSASDFKFTGASINGGVETAFESDGSNSYSVNAGTYSAVETNIPIGYTMTGNTCEDVVVANGGTASCTITNNDNAPSLTLNKILVKDNGGGAVESDWTLNAVGTLENPTNLSGPGAAGSADVASGAGFKADTYTLSESAGPSGYTPSSWTCTNGVSVNANNQISLDNGQTTVCTITNDDQAGTLTVNKVVTNDNGGTKTASDFKFTASGVNGGVETAFEADGSNSYSVNAGTYNVSETSITAGYTMTGNTCVNVVVVNGGTATCTITNNDIAPRVIVEKYVVNNNSGTAIGSDFGITVDGIEQNMELEDENGSVKSYVAETTVMANKNILISEINHPDYDEGEWYCDLANELGQSGSGLDVTINLLPGQTASCFVWNNDTAHPQIHIKKYGPAVAHEGDTIKFTADITNTGDSPLSVIGIFDDVAGNVSSVDDVDGFNMGDADKDNLLDIGETWKAEVEYTVPAGQTEDIVNTMEVCADDATEWMEWSELLIVRSLDSVDEIVTELDGDTCDTDTHTTDVIHPALKVVKSGPTSAQAGEKVTYSFTVTNSGDTPITVTKVEDSIAGNGTYKSGDTDSDKMLDLTETWLYFASYTISAGQVMPVNNTVTVCGEDELKQEVCVNDKHTLSIPQVLAAVTTSKLVVLADTGAKNLVVQLIAGFGIITMAIALAVRRKQQN